MNNIFEMMPELLVEEQFDEIVRGEQIRIERIVSQGHTSPVSGWYDQKENEWVVVLQGSGVIQFQDGDEVYLEAGDFLNILAHRKHKVIWTAPDKPTIWLAVFY